MYTARIINIVELDANEFSFRGLKDLATNYKYDIEIFIVYFKTNNRDFTDGASILYDDTFVIKLIDVCMPYGRIKFYVDHLLDNIELETNAKRTASLIYDENVENSGEDSDYKIETESSEDYSEYSDFVISDEEEIVFKEKSSLFKKG